MTASYLRNPIDAPDRSVFDLDQLPARVRSKIQMRPCDIPGLSAFCWEWTGFCRPPYGYGYVRYQGHIRFIHRVTYVILVGPIPEGLELDHLCRFTSCCNPAHLEPVTHKVNSERGRNATKTHCSNQHEFSGENFYVNGRGERVCRLCARDRSRARTASRRLARSSA